MSRKILIVAAVVSAVVMLLGTQAAWADPITLQNPSFESPIVDEQNPNASWQGNPDSWKLYDQGGWSTYMYSGTNVSDTFGAVAPAGNQAIEVEGEAMSPGHYHRYWQNTGYQLQKNDSVTLSWYGSAESIDTLGANEYAFFDAADNATDDGVAFGVPDAKVAYYGSWTQFSYTAQYTGDSGKYLVAAFGGSSADTSNLWGAGFDNLSLSVTPSRNLRRWCCLRGPYQPAGLRLAKAEVI